MQCHHSSLSCVALVHNDTRALAPNWNCRKVVNYSVNAPSCCKPVRADCCFTTERRCAHITRSAEGDVTFIPKKNLKVNVTFALQAQDAGGELSGQVATVVVVGEWVVGEWPGGVGDGGIACVLWLCLPLFVFPHHG